jgi:hypothetical protein
LRPGRRLSGSWSWACATGRSVVGQRPEAPVAPVLRARSVTDLVAAHARPRRGVKRPTAQRASPRHTGLPDGLADRGRPESCARANGASRDLSHPHHAERLTTPRARPRPLAARRPCAFGAAQFSVARGARLSAASCFHTLVSPIDSTAGLRGGTVRVALRTAARNQVRCCSPRCSGRRSGC